MCTCISVCRHVSFFTYAFFSGIRRNSFYHYYLPFKKSNQPIPATHGALRCWLQQLLRVQIQPLKFYFGSLMIAVAGPTCLLFDFATWFVVQLVVFHIYLLQATNTPACTYTNTHLDNLLACAMVLLQVLISH